MMTRTPYEFRLMAKENTSVIKWTFTQRKNFCMKYEYFFWFYLQTNASTAQTQSFTCFSNSILLLTICLHSKFQHYQSFQKLNDRIFTPCIYKIMKIYLSELSSMLNHIKSIHLQRSFGMCFENVTITH